MCIDSAGDIYTIAGAVAHNPQSTSLATTTTWFPGRGRAVRQFGWGVTW